MPASQKKRVLAVASGGGHWIQLMRIMPALENFDVSFVSVREDYRSQVTGHNFYVVQDSNKASKLRVIWSALQLLRIVMLARPDVVISTGAAPGYLAIRWGKLIGARSIWIDSIANAEKLSLSGRMVGRHADLWLTQWPQLARPEGPQFVGGVV